MDNALEDLLSPIYEIMSPDTVTEVSINEPHKVFVEDGGVWSLVHLDKFTPSYLYALSKFIAAFNAQTIDDSRPLLSGSLPSGDRVQIVAPPCVKDAPILSIRKANKSRLTYNDFKHQGAFELIETVSDDGLSVVDAGLCDLLADCDYYSFIKEAVLRKKTIIIAGGTSSGKTTFFNALLQLVPPEERIITIEDTREIILDQNNKIHLLATKGNTGTATITFSDLVEASLRLRPDRLMAAELRGAEAFSFLNAVNTGHPGSITTIHANSASDTFTRLMTMFAQANTGLDYKSTNVYIRSVVDVVIFVSRNDGSRGPREVWFNAFQHNRLSE